MYSVIIAVSAQGDIAHHYPYLQEHARSPGYPDVWYDSIEQAIFGLGDFPLSFALAPENAEFEDEIRHRIVGSYRVLFTVTASSVPCSTCGMAGRISSARPEAIIAAAAPHLRYI